MHDTAAEPLPSSHVHQPSPVRAAIEAARSIRDGPLVLNHRRKHRDVLRAAQHGVRRALAASWSTTHRCESRYAWTTAAMAWSFWFRLRRRAELSTSAVERRMATARRSRVLELLASSPKPLFDHDVGVTIDGALNYRSACGVVSSSHPAKQPDTLITPGSALKSDGSLIAPLLPPQDSDYVLCPDASGAMCYYHTELGLVQWEPPAGSTPLRHVPLATPPQPFDIPPPRFPEGLGLNSLRRTGWYPLFLDADHHIHLYHAETGAVHARRRGSHSAITMAECSSLTWSPRPLDGCLRTAGWKHGCRVLLAKV